jgi:SAM-dependent methyltransferase
MTVTTQNQPAEIFDRMLLRLRRKRALPNFDKHDFLFRRTAAEIAERLIAINRRFETVVDLGSRAGEFTTACRLNPEIGERIGPVIETTLIPVRSAVRRHMALVCDDEIPPFGPSALDLVISNLNFQVVNDLPGALIQVRRSLRADGLLLAATFGADTLNELRQALTAAEIEIDGGVSPRISPFIDIRDAGALLQRAGFALPVVDSDMVTVTYDSPSALLEDIRGMGESSILRDRRKTPSKRSLFARMSEIYKRDYAGSDGRISATFEILYLTAWAPHEGQQQPLRPGSAKHRLADALGAREIKSGEKTPELKKP